MLKWDVQPAKEVINDKLLSILEAEELMLSTYVEEQDKWNKDILKLEQAIQSKGEELRKLAAVKVKWWEVFTSRPTNKLKHMIKVKTELDTLHTSYLKRITEQPKPDRYELGMYAGRLFRSR
jgi:hypothetical protein